MKNELKLITYESSKIQNSTPAFEISFRTCGSPDGQFLVPLKSREFRRRPHLEETEAFPSALGTFPHRAFPCSSFLKRNSSPRTLQGIAILNLSDKLWGTLGTEAGPRLEIQSDESRVEFEQRQVRSWFTSVLVAVQCTKRDEFQGSEAFLGLPLSPPCSVRGATIATSATRGPRESVAAPPTAPISPCGAPAGRGRCQHAKHAGLCSSPRVTALRHSPRPLVAMTTGAVGGAAREAASAVGK